MKGCVENFKNGLFLVFTSGTFFGNIRNYSYIGIILFNVYFGIILMTFEIIMKVWVYSDAVGKAGAASVLTGTVPGRPGSSNNPVIWKLIT